MQDAFWAAEGFAPALRKERHFGRSMRAACATAQGIWPPNSTICSGAFEPLLRNANGKIQKTLLRERLPAEIASPEA